MADMTAGITGAIIVLPQGIAFASIAGLPAEYGLYSAMAPAIIAAVFGSSYHLISGPTTAISIVVFSKISTLAGPFTDQYIQLALTLTLIAGVFQLVLGLARMGVLVNFVSYSVLVGFTTGAAILIGTGQLAGALGISVAKGSSFLATWVGVCGSLSHADPRVMAISLGTLISAVLVKRFFPRLPGLAVAMIFGSLLAWLLDGRTHNLSYVGSLPSHLPPFSMPDISIDAIRQLVPGATAVAMLGLAEAASIARSVATLSNQRTNNNQEFIGQGLSNIIGSFFSCYASSGSFTRTGVNYNAGAKTPMAAVYGGIFLLVLLFFVAPLTAYLPVASMSGILLLVAFNLIEYEHIKTIWHTSRSEALILVITFLCTLFLDLEFALFLGVLLSLLLYLSRTSHPHFTTVARSHEGGCLVDTGDPGSCVPECPQLKIIRIDGSIFFGAVDHISERLRNIVSQNPEQCHILIIASGINFIDVTGCAMLFHESRSMYLEGRQLYLCSLKNDVIRMLERGNCTRAIGRENIFGSRGEALEKIIHKLDPERCRQCSVRVFQECEQRPGAKRMESRDFGRVKSPASFGNYAGNSMAYNTYEDAIDIKVCRGEIDYRGIVEHINDGVIIIREGKIVFANNAFCGISRRSPEEVINSEFSDYISSEDRETVLRYCTDRLFTEGLPDTIEFTMPRPAGDAIIEMKVNVVECGGGPAILGALTDITERRKTRVDLQRIKDRLESIIHSMHEVVVSLSVKDYSITSINPAAEALYGIPLRDFTLGLIHIIDFVHPDDVEMVNQFYLDLPEAEFDEMEYRIVSNDKQVKWVLDEGHVVYSHKGVIRRMDHVIRDITEEKKVSDALRRSEAKYRNFFDSTSDMAFTLTPEGRFLDINDAGLNLLGLESKEEALASNMEDFYEDISERVGLVEEIYTKGHVEGKQVKFRNRAGDIIEVAVTAHARADESGQLLYHEGIIHNITKALEDQRNRVLRNAAGSMCHYLNTHLMHMLNSKGGVRDLMAVMDTLIENLPKGEDGPESVRQMRETMKEMRYFFEGIDIAYDKISEITKAFNKAFHYKEEAYVNSTILDIFKACGYEGEEE